MSWIHLSGGGSDCRWVGEDAVQWATCDE